MKKTAMAVIGAGSWGTALAQNLASLNHEVRLWTYEREVADSILSVRENRQYLPGIKLLEAVRPTTDLAEAVDGTGYVLSAVPSHSCRTLYEQMLPYLQQEMIMVSATKGLEEASLMRMSAVIQSVVEKRFYPRLGVLSGPSFAQEVALGQPTALVVASQDPDVARAIQEDFSSKVFRLYATEDVTGVELGGAIKNVIAIAAGAIEGLELGHNPMAALITRGLAEISRLGCACGARGETLSGLAGLGDLVLTCTGNLSRNRSVGVQLGRGKKLQEILASTNTVAEGVLTTGSTVKLAGLHDVDMPITQQVNRILQNEISPKNAIRELMDRSLKKE